MSSPNGISVCGYTHTPKLKRGASSSKTSETQQATESTSGLTTSLTRRDGGRFSWTTASLCSSTAPTLSSMTEGPLLRRPVVLLGWRADLCPDVGVIYRSHSIRRSFLTAAGAADRGDSI